MRESSGVCGVNDLNNCSFVKTILMLLVIYGHAIAFWSENWFTVETPIIKCAELSILYSWIDSFHIYGFTLVSGYIFAFKVLRGEYNEYQSFLYNKTKRLLVPYAFTMLIWVAPISEYFFEWNTVYLFRKYVLCINPSQLWFLWMLYWVFVIAWPLRMIMIRRPTLSWGISIIFYLTGIICLKFFFNLYCIWTAFRYLIFFNLGFQIRVKQERGKKLIINCVPWGVWILFDILLFLILTKTNIITGILSSLVHHGLNMMLNVVGAIMSWIVLQGLSTNTNCWKKSKLFAALSKYSMPMFLFHQQLIYFAIVWFNGKTNPWTNAGINFIVALTGAFLISFALMHCKQTRVLIGEKA